MIDLVQHSSAPTSTIASIINTSYGLSLLGRDVCNRTYNYTQSSSTSTAKFIGTIGDQGYIYRVMLARDNTVEELLRLHATRYPC
ncbi:hypothetical protein LIPSTDRAFT_67824 [Lipomyces starkeyi NRRL Y-11557]|uniref:Uncharacterized protein n=1 Tax=Lipomyces starkeyi NRRL Y-11557 TaxID=675824 RepID=A0A1E3QIL1_LIPST|nr:hypothetical protein LIPSTDRAFT_67824 [Lipomyces starkeyi NRRL Y-11557]